MYHPARSSQNKLIFLWNNLGPMHVDRIKAVADRFPNKSIYGVEIFDRDVTYEWHSDVRGGFNKETIFCESSNPNLFMRIFGVVMSFRKLGRGCWFLCHYERPEILLLATLLRLTRSEVYTMGCSKFDDFQRSAFREWMKTFYLLPYHGVISAPARSESYFRFLGMNGRRVAVPYNTLSIDRMRAQAHDAVRGSFDEKSWVIVARLVEKKNLSVALRAFQIYRRNGGKRHLSLCGSGPLEGRLKDEAAELNIGDAVKFHGFVQTEGVSRIMAGGIALILPSVEEQFGNVVIEAQALNLPVLISNQCGAREYLVQDWVNGFSFPHDCPESLAGYMSILDQDETLWKRLSSGAAESAPRCDVAAFASAVESILQEP